MKLSTASLRYYEREIFRENRFLGLPNGIAATGPAILTALTCLRLSLDHTDVLMWLLPGIAYLITYSLLVAHLPRRVVLKQWARQALCEELMREARQLELSFDEDEIADMLDEAQGISLPASFRYTDHELA